MQIELPCQLPGPCLEGPTLGGGVLHTPPPAARHFGVPRGDVQSPCARCWPFQTRVGVAAGAIRATNSWDPVSGTQAHKQGERGAAPHSLRHRRVCAPLLSGADSSRGRNQAVTPVVAGQVNSALSRRARAPGHPDSTQGQRGPSGDQRGPATGGPAFAGAARARAPGEGSTPSAGGTNPDGAAHLEVVRGVYDADKLPGGGENPFGLVVLEAEVDEI